MGDLFEGEGESPPIKKKRKSKAKAKGKSRSKSKARPKPQAQAKTPVKRKPKPKAKALQIDDLREFICHDERGRCFHDAMGNKIYPGHIGLLTEQQGEILIRHEMGAWRE